MKYNCILPCAVLFFIVFVLLQCNVAVVDAISSYDGWRMKDRYSAFRYEIEGNYDRHALAIILRDRATQFSAFGK